MFGVHDLNILLRYPFFSADASSNIKKAAFGGSAFGLSKAPNKSINYLKHLKLEKSTHRYFSLAQEQNHIEKYITDVWRKRGIIW